MGRSALEGAQIQEGLDWGGAAARANNLHRAAIQRVRCFLDRVVWLRRTEVGDGHVIPGVAVRDAQRRVIERGAIKSDPIVGQSNQERHQL